MKTTNTLDKSFGPIGSTAGYFLIIAGIIATYTSLFGLILVALGALLGFTSTCTIIDFDNKRIKFSEILFGILPTGKWIPIVPGMTIGIKESKITWTGYSRSNRSLDIDNKDFRLILFDAENTEIMPIKKTDSLDSAIAEQETLCNKLELLAIE
jgi:hypothetical protein